MGRLERLKDDEQGAEIRRLRATNASLRVSNRQLSRHLVTVERELDAFLALDTRRRSPPKIRRRAPSGTAEATALVLASDWHVEEEVLAKTVNGLNRYNPDVAKKRAKKFFQGVLRLTNMARATTQVKDLVLWLGGDFITGWIHEEFQESNDRGPVEAAWFAEDLLSSGLTFLQEHGEFERILVPCSMGNHGRLTKERRFAKPRGSNLEAGIYRNLAHLHPEIEFIRPEGAVTYADIYGLRVRFTHGDLATYRGGMTGLRAPLKRLGTELDKARRADLTCIGHFHQLTGAGDWLLANGSLIGYSAYSMRFGYEPPRQAFALIDKERGKSLVAPIWVD
jgi:hypothetical protein